MKTTRIWLVVAILLLFATGVAMGGAAKETQKAEPGGPITLRYTSNMWRDQAIATQEKQLAAFKAANPNINLEPTLYVPWADYRTLLLRAIASNTVPDVIQHGVEFLDEFASYGTFQVLDDLITSEHYDRIIEPAWETARVNGRVQGLPHMIWIEPAWMYRTDILADEGIAAPSVASPWSMDEALSVATKLTKDFDGDGTTDRWGWVERGRAGWIFMKHFEWHIFTGDGAIVQQLPDGRFKSGITLPNTQEAIRFFVDLHTTHKVAPEAAIGYGFEDWRSGFISGKIAMGSMGTWLGSLLFRENPDVEWTAVSLPYSKTPITSVAAFTMSVSSKTPHPQAAWELAKWLTMNTLEDRIKICDVQGGVTVFKEVLQRADYQNEPIRGVFKPFFDSFITGNVANVRTWARNPSPQYADIMVSVVAPTVHNIILGKVSFDEGMAQMDREINRKVLYRE